MFNLNDIKIVTKYANDINKIEGSINEIKQKINICLDKKEKNQLQKDLTNYKNRVSALRIDAVCYLKNNPENDDLWQSSSSRREIFKQVHVYFGKGYIGNYDVSDWKHIYKFFVSFLEYEINDMLELRTKSTFDLTENKKPKSLLVRQVIENCFDYLKEVQENFYGYTYEGTEAFNSLKDINEIKETLQEIYAHLLYEESEYDAALQLYTRLAKERSKRDISWHSSTYARKGDIYCAMDRYDLALEEYDLADSVLDGSMNDEEQIKEVKERRNQIVAILG